MNKTVFYSRCDSAIRENPVNALSVAIRKNCHTLDWEVVLLGDWRLYWEVPLYVLPPVEPYTKDNPKLIKEFQKYTRWLSDWSKNENAG